MEISFPLVFWEKKRVANIKISRLYTDIQPSDSLENMDNWPAVQHGLSGGKTAPPSRQASAAQGPAWPPSPTIISLAPRAMSL